MTNRWDTLNRVKNLGHLTEISNQCFIMPGIFVSSRCFPGIFLRVLSRLKDIRFPRWDASTCRASRISRGQLLPCRVVHGCLNHFPGYPTEGNQRLSTLAAASPPSNHHIPAPPALIRLRFERVAQRRGDLHSPSVCCVLLSHTHLYIRIPILSRIIPGFNFLIFDRFRHL